MKKNQNVLTEKTIATQLRQLRLKKGKTQKEVAKALHVNHRTISCYECGSREPSLSILRQFAEYFDVPIHYFLPDCKYSDEEIFLIKMYRTLASNHKKMVQFFVADRLFEK